MEQVAGYTQGINTMSLASLAKGLSVCQKVEALQFRVQSKLCSRLTKCSASDIELRLSLPLISRKINSQREEILSKFNICPPKYVFYTKSFRIRNITPQILLVLLFVVRERACQMCLTAFLSLFRR